MNKPNQLRQLGASATAALLLGLLLSSCAREQPGTYGTPEEAVAALDSVVGTGDQARAEAIFGPGSIDLFRTGDQEEDRKAAARVKAMLAEKVGFEEIDENTRVALLGDEEWPFPIPLTRAGGRWRFDTEQGREELLNRRVGFYELSTLSSLHEYVDAQREYAATARDGKPRAFAQRFASTEGQQDGLFWPVAEGEAPSPLGELLAEAAHHQAGEPFQGYHYRLLTAQGEHAPGGARSYIDSNGLMTGGFAAVAWPAKYGNSGVMTFLVNHRGIVFEKDLGPETATAAAAIQAFDPDDTWMPTGDFLWAEEGAGSEGEGEVPPPAAGT